MTAPTIISGMRVRCRESRWYCLCGQCVVTDAETLTVLERKYFPGLGPMLKFEEHQDDQHEPWFLASAFLPRHDG
jgi:hypothetical protein